MLFRQTEENEWTLAGNTSAVSPGDVLTLNLSLNDPSFTHYTALDAGFHPSAARVLNFPEEGGIVDAAAAIYEEDRRCGFGEGFCTLALQLTENTLQKADNGCPVENVMRFRTPSVRWEYLFMPHDGDNTPVESLRLEDMAGTVAFSPFNSGEAYGCRMWRTVSTDEIPLRRSYGCRLRLTAQEGGSRRSVLLTRVGPPVAGRFTDAASGVIRQVCHC